MIIIIGAGLSGLLTAYRLQQAGISYKILEARDRVGGRIHTVQGARDTPVELGATWFGQQHKHLKNLLEEFKIAGYEQFMKGKVYFQPFSTAPAQSIEIPGQAPSYRISGGSSQLIHTLCAQLDPEAIILNEAVKSIQFKNEEIRIQANSLYKAQAVVLALPPKLWATRIDFQPELPENLMHISSQTQTWMEDSVKVALIYKNPFWEAGKLSGTLFSNTGPLTEFYDHCDHAREKYALCGFMNTSFKVLDAEERKARVLQQLELVYGAQALDFLEYRECIWSADAYTYEPSATPLFPHQNNGNAVFRDAYSSQRLFFGGSETSADFPGYMDGAVCAANRVSEELIAALNSQAN